MLFIQCSPLNRITVGQYASDNINRMIQLTDVFCVLFRPAMADYNKGLILLSVIQISGGHSTFDTFSHLFVYGLKTNLLLS